MKQTILVTGGAGFIGSTLIRYLIDETNHQVVSLDKLTYASNLKSLESVKANVRYHFVRGDICDGHLVRKIFLDHQPDCVLHLAAESHVDRSINSPGEFIQTNIVGTYILLEATREYLQNHSPAKRNGFRFHHISTDEVFGELADTGLFTETSAYCPSSPYAASKASSDHLVRAWGRTFDIPYLLSNCSNNYGPYQNAEKFIPTIISNALTGKPIPIYGDGKQVRDWLYVEDHVRALALVLEKGHPGESYNIGGDAEKRNLEIVETICGYLNDLVLKKPTGVSDFRSLISFVKDRPGHDRRYAIDASKIREQLDWSPRETFESGIVKTIKWYLGESRRVSE